MVIVTNQVANVVTTLLGVRMLILGLLMYCDSFKKIIFKKTVAKLMGNIQEPVCSLIDTAFSRHHGQNLFSVWEIIQLLELLGGWNICCHERYFLKVAKCVRSWIFWTRSMKLKTWGICLPFYLLLLRLLWGVSLRVGRLQLTWNSTNPGKELLKQL